METSCQTSLVDGESEKSKLAFISLRRTGACRFLCANSLADLETRLASPIAGQSDQTARDLAFAEGRFLYIDPFEDFNGRVTRLFLFELLHRMDLPIMDTATRTPEEKDRYLEALGAYDRNDPRPLVAIWKRRIAMAA